MMTTAGSLTTDSPRRHRVLFLFDEPSTPARYYEGLCDAGFDVLLETDFDRAMITAAIELPDVIVVDVHSRHQERTQFLERVFCNARTESIPLLLVSDSVDRVTDHPRSRSLSLYPRFQAPYCLGAHLRRRFLVPDGSARPSGREAY